MIVVDVDMIFGIAGLRKVRCLEIGIARLIDVLPDRVDDGVYMGDLLLSFGVGGMMGREGGAGFVMHNKIY